MASDTTTRFEIGARAARDSLAEGGKARSVPDYDGYGHESARAEWTRGWNSVIDGPEGDAWRAKARAERGEVERAAIVGSRDAAAERKDTERAEEALRLVGLANAVLDAPFDIHDSVAVRASDVRGRELARAVLDSKVLR